MHHASSTGAPAIKGALSVTGCGLHSTSRQSARMEMGRPTEAIDDMAQGVPLRSMPGSDITPPARARRSHHSEQTKATKSDGPTHPLKPSCAGANLHNTNPTGIPSGASKEERTGRKVGLTSHLTVQTSGRTRSRRPS